MDNKRALELINTLASGVDPFTGEVYGEAHVLQNPETVRALFLASQALEAQSKKSVKRNDPNLPANAGQPWSEVDDQKLIASFDAGHADKELAATHERTLGAIRARLIKLGKLEPPTNEGKT